MALLLSMHCLLVLNIRLLTLISQTIASPLDFAWILADSNS